MNEHDGLEPTVAIPRVDVSRAAIAPPDSQAVVPRPIPAQTYPSQPVSPTVRAPFVFGNPLVYALRRFLAFSLDIALVTSVVTMLLYGLIAINPFSGMPNDSERGFDATLGMAVVIALVYLWLFEAAAGTTLGKLAFSLHVYTPRRGFVGFGRAFVRNLLRPVDMIFIGPVLAIAPGHRRLGDLLGGTVVAHSPLRAFSPLVGWILIVALAAVPFLVGGGTITVLAVASAFVEFVPPLLVRGVHAVWLLFGASGVHLPTATG